jgi:folate-binding protein YgfZ
MLSWVYAKGDDAESFLQAQFTNDLSTLDKSHSQLHGYCNPKGRLLCIVRLVRHDDGFLLQLPSQLCDAIIERLRKYVLRAKVVLNTADDLAGIGVAGHRATEMLTQHLGPLPDTGNGYLRQGVLGVYGLPGSLPRFQVIGPRPGLQPLWDTLSALLRPQEARSWAHLDIGAGIPQILPPTSEAFVPQMVNLDLVGGVSFQKGCYPGQEIVARMHYLGKLKQRMIRAQVTTNAAPKPGDKIYSPEHREQSVGTLVDAQPSGPGCFDVLAVVQLTAYRAGRLFLNHSDGPALEPRSLPYDVPTD